MNSFFLIDKPLGISSFDIIRKLRRILNTKKIGHTGTLDPLATGAVILAVGGYTKLIPYLEKDIKEYEFEVMLDGVTDSFDLGEQVQFISEDDRKKYSKKITKSSIQKLLESDFKGEVKQVPPKYSALKIDGRRAYDLARAGEDVQIKPREVTVYSIEILSYDYPTLNLRAKVSAGTYIRSIAHDLGQLLGSGGYVSKLRRTKIGDIGIKEAQNLDNFDISKTLDTKNLFSSHSFIELEDNTLSKINTGLKVPGEFDFELNKDLFVENKAKVTNIVNYDGEKLVPKRKI